MTDPSRPVYLDHHATTPTDPLVVKAMLPYFTERFGNASSGNHVYGEAAHAAVEAAREQVALLVGVESKSVLFTSGATEANNLAVKGVMRASPGGGHLVVNAAEHRAVLDPARRLEKEGHTVTVLPVDRHGLVDPERVRDALRPDTRLVSAMLANNEIGTINPIAEIAEVCREHGVPLHCDAAQAVGRIPVATAVLGVDLLSFTGHKFHGPKGVGALVVRRGEPRVRIEPLVHGGGQERNLRAGTVPVPLVVGLGRACELAADRLEADWSHVRSLRDRLRTGLFDAIPDLLENGHLDLRLPGNQNVSVPGVDGDALLAGLTEVAVSSGSACSTTIPEPSHVLRAIGRDDALARASLRFGVGRTNTADEIERAVEHVAGVVRRLRG